MIYALHVEVHNATLTLYVITVSLDLMKTGLEYRYLQ